ncbi:MAG: cyclic nucleotide-binding domain-containing protein [Oscillatoriales cyanobacterium SM2_1_8]|nr:cyclic nucleotide-binding domain-containing protein [Oscillatoriales cyanobacterium SM2_1_8]
MKPMPAMLSRARQELLESLQRVPYFAELPADELLTMTQQGFRRTFSPQEFICQEGDIGNSLYIVLVGQAEVLSFQRQMRLAVLEPGDFFGEVALFTGRLRVASVRALTEVKSFVVPRDYLKHVLSQHPSLSGYLAKVLAERQEVLLRLGILQECPIDTTRSDALLAASQAIRFVLGL